MNANKKKQGKLQAFVSYYKPYRGMFFLDMFCALCIALADLVFPQLTRYSVENLLPGGQYRAFFLFIAGLVGIYLLRWLMQYIVGYIGHIMGVRMEADMRRDIFTHLQKLSFRYYDNTRTGHLMSRVTNDLFEITELAHHGPEDLFISVITLGGALIALGMIQWKLTLVLLVMIPLILFFAVFLRKNMNKVSRQVKSKTATINANLESSISGVRVAQAFANESYEIDKFMSGNDQYRLAKDSYYKVMATFNSGIDFMTNLMYVVALGYGGFLIFRGEMKTLDLLAFTLYINTFLSPIRKLTNFAEQYTAGIAGFDRMQELMAVEPEIQDRKNAVDLQHVQGHIRFDDVSFSYDRTDDHAVLNHINLDIQPGRMLALVGPSGGGKSTLCQLIPRFYDVLDGSVSIDGQDVRDITLHSLRANIGIVQQEVFLFAGSIRDNIRYGNIAADDNEIIEAAKQAEIHDFILTLPEGYDTNVGERGVMLSGGQKQRIAIARIFLKNPPILILDEATSALDTQTELRIQRALDALAKGRTTLVIAHRLSTIHNADEIIVVGQTGILQRGNHESLLQEGGEYAHLYNAQSQHQSS